MRGKRQSILASGANGTWLASSTGDALWFLLVLDPKQRDVVPQSQAGPSSNTVARFMVITSPS